MLTSSFVDPDPDRTPSVRRSSRDDQYHGVMPRSCKALQVPGSVNFCEAVSRRHDGGHRIGGRSVQLGHKPADAVALGLEVRPVTVRQCFEFYQFSLQCVDRRGQGGQGGIDRVIRPVPNLLLV